MEKSDHLVVIVGSTRIVSLQSLVLATHVFSCSDVVSSCLQSERINRAGDVYAKSVQQMIKGLINCSSLLLQRVKHRVPIELIQVPEKSTGALCCDRVRGESRTREVFPVVRYDCLRTGSDRRREDMAIFIVVCHGRNQILVAFHPSFPEVFADLPLAVSRSAVTPKFCWRFRLTSVRIWSVHFGR
jgi:hypothetical protein